MRKCFLLLPFVLLFVRSNSQDIEKIRKEFENMMANPKSVLYGNNKATGKYYNIRGFKMYCEVYGQGQPLLLIHGNGGSINNFVKQIPYFSKKYKVIVADSRNHGKSPDTGDSLTYEMMADDYAALLDAMKIDSVNLIGWSDGGILGLLLATRHPKKIKKMAITGTNLQPDTTAVPKEIWDMVTPAYSMLKEKADKNAEEKSGFKLLRLLVEQPNIPVQELHRISCPSLIIGGDHDVIKVEHTMLIYRNIPKSYLWIVPNSGHSPSVVYADEFNKKIDDFFKSKYRQIQGEGMFF